MYNLSMLLTNFSVFLFVVILYIIFCPITSIFANFTYENLNIIRFAHTFCSFCTSFCYLCTINPLGFPRQNPIFIAESPDFLPSFADFYTFFAQFSPLFRRTLQTFYAFSPFLSSFAARLSLRGCYVSPSKKPLSFVAFHYYIRLNVP